jgi:rhodanese-related sulfurtransferase
MNVKEITSLESWNLLQNEGSAVLIDVRTVNEFSVVGVSDLSEINQEPILLPWRDGPDMAIDGQFSNRLTIDLLARFGEKKVDLLFICRSGARSHEAASSFSNSGYECYNVTDGFEGEVDELGQRGKINGWKAANLAWGKK